MHLITDRLTLPMPDRIIVPLIVACALFMENMDSTVITTALPAIAVDLKVDPISLKLALTSYLLSLAVFIPISGWMADRFGARTIFRAAIIVFTLGSAACGFAQGLNDLVLYRVIQGLGGAMMVPVGRLVLLRTVPKHELVQALTWLIVPALLGPMLGPPLGGFITTYFHWRWIFWINIPIGMLGLALATIFIENIREPKMPPLDKRGFVLSGIGLSGLAFGLATFGQGLLPPIAAATLVVIGAIFTNAFVRHARSIKAPLLNLKVFRLPTFRASVIGSSLFRVGIGAMAFLLPLLFQLGFNMTPFQSGMLTFWGAIGAMAMRVTAPFVLRRFGFRRVIVFNGLLAGFFIALPAFFTAATPYSIVAGALLVGGFFRSLQFTSANSLAFADLDQRQMSQATSITSVAQQLALSTGVAVAALALDATRFARGDIVLVAADFAPAFALVGVVAMCSVLFFLHLPRDAGAALTAPKKVAETAREPELPG
ncbi:MAG TPA: MFS transporter [Xanthobacteraceae bacterium]|jgi:EmrB/QacA subfamily drug resistance transporter